MVRLNIGFIGFGNHAAKHHAKYLVDNCSDTVRIAAIGDILQTDIPFVHRQLRQLGLQDVPIHIVKAHMSDDLSDTHSVEELLEEHPELNAVIISTPNAKHYYQIKACLERQLHVLVDKPMALTYEHAKHLVDLANSLHGPYLVVSSQRRYEDVYQYAKKAIDANELGRIINIESSISHSHNWLQGWQSDPNLAGGGALWSLGWHTLDTIIYLVDKKAIAVDAALYYPENVAVETYANALIHFEGGLSVIVSANLGAPANSVYERLQIWGTRGTLILDRCKPIYDTLRAVVIHQLDNGRLLEPALTEATVKKRSPDEAFIKLLTSIENPMADFKKAESSVISMGADSLETIRVIEAIYTSAEKYKRVDLTES